MAIHGSQDMLTIQRQPKPSNPYAVARYRVTLVRDGRATAPASPLLTSVGAADILRPLFAHLDREQFLVCGLDAKHGIIGVNVVSVGSLTLSIVHPREVFKPLILMNAAAWICAHNHPSGDITPSPEDRVLTSRLRQGAELLGITLLDHLILTARAATASPIRAGPVREGSGPEQSEHPEHRRRRQRDPDHCRTPPHDIRRQRLA